MEPFNNSNFYLNFYLIKVKKYEKCFLFTSLILKKIKKFLKNIKIIYLDELKFSFAK